MSISSTISTSKLMSESEGLATPIHHYNATEFGSLMNQLEHKGRGLTRSMRQVIFTLGRRFGHDRVLTFKFCVNGVDNCLMKVDYYAEAVKALEGHEHGIQDHIIAWTLSVLDEYRAMAMYKLATTGKPSYPDFIDNLFVDYDYVDDYRGVQMIVPVFRFVVPCNWERTFNETKKQEMARAIGQLCWEFRHGMIRPFESSAVKERLVAAAVWLDEWRRGTKLASQLSEGAL